MSNRRFYFHVVLLISALLVGGVSLWHSGWWMEGRNGVPNFTAISMVLLVISQVLALRARMKKNKIEP